MWDNAGGKEWGWGRGPWKLRVCESLSWGLGALCLLCGWLCLYHSLYLASESSERQTGGRVPHTLCT